MSELSKQAIEFKLNQLDTVTVDKPVTYSKAATFGSTVDVAGTATVADLAVTGSISGLTEYATNAAAVSGGLVIGELYTTAGAVKVVTA